MPLLELCEVYVHHITIHYIELLMSQLTQPPHYSTIAKKILLYLQPARQAMRSDSKRSHEMWLHTLRQGENSPLVIWLSFISVKCSKIFIQLFTYTSLNVLIVTSEKWTIRFVFGVL